MMLLTFLNKLTYKLFIGKQVPIFRNDNPVISIQASNDELKKVLLLVSIHTVIKPNLISITDTRDIHTILTNWYEPQTESKIMNASVKEMAQQLTELLKNLELSEDDQSAFDRWQRPVPLSLLTAIRDMKHGIQNLTKQILNALLEE